MWNSTVFEMILSCAFEPQSLGFNMADLEVLEKLPEQVPSAFLVTILSLSPEPGQCESPAEARVLIPTGVKFLRREMQGEPNLIKSN